MNVQPVSKNAVNAAKADNTSNSQTATSAPAQENHLSPQKKMEAELKKGQEEQQEEQQKIGVRGDVKEDILAKSREQQAAQKNEALDQWVQGGAKSADKAQKAGGALETASGMAATFGGPIGAIVGVGLAIVGFFTKLFGGKSAEEKKKEAEQIKAAEAKQKALTDKSANHKRDVEGPQFAGGQKSSAGQLMADATKKDTNVGDKGSLQAQATAEAAA